jgi:hypothetical protein
MMLKVEMLAVYRYLQQMDKMKQIIKIPILGRIFMPTFKKQDLCSKSVLSVS